MVNMGDGPALQAWHVEVFAWVGRGGWTETLSGHFSQPATPMLRGVHISEVQGRALVLWEQVPSFLTWRGWASQPPHCPWVQLLSILIPCTLPACASHASCFVMLALPGPSSSWPWFHPQSQPWHPGFAHLQVQLSLFLSLPLSHFFPHYVTFHLNSAQHRKRGHALGSDLGWLFDFVS